MTARNAQQLLRNRQWYMQRRVVVGFAHRGEKAAHSAFDRMMPPVAVFARRTTVSPTLTPRLSASPRPSKMPFGSLLESFCPEEIGSIGLAWRSASGSTSFANK